MKRCVVCGAQATGACPTMIGFINRAGDKPHIYQVCGKPLCDNCGHGHGEPTKTVPDLKLMEEK